MTIYLAIRNRAEIIEPFQATSDTEGWDHIHTYHPGAYLFKHDDGDLLVNPDGTIIAPIFRSIDEAPGGGE